MHCFFPARTEHYLVMVFYDLSEIFSVLLSLIFRIMFIHTLYLRDRSQTYAYIGTVRTPVYGQAIE